MERRVVIIRTGIGGLLACKYSVEKGFDPVVFEANYHIGGVWNHTMQSTRLQNAKEDYRFSDFDWPASVLEKFPSNTEVLDSVESYAQHFNLYPYIKFHSRVISINYVGVSFDEMKTWDLWGGTGTHSAQKGSGMLLSWTETNATEVHKAQFVILCIERFSSLPTIPELPPNYCSKVFDGKVMHSMEYSDMEKSVAAELIQEAVECAEIL